MLLVTRKVKVLGFYFNFTTLTLELPENKQKTIQSAISKLQVLSSFKIHLLVRLLGLLTSECPTVLYGWLYTQRLEREKALALGKSSGNFNA